MYSSIGHILGSLQGRDSSGNIKFLMQLKVWPLGSREEIRKNLI